MLRQSVFRRLDFCWRYFGPQFSPSDEGPLEVSQLHSQAFQSKREVSIWVEGNHDS